MVHLFGSLVPLKSGVAVGVGLSAFAVQRPNENRTQARSTRTDPPTRRRNCASLETISNLFIKALLLKVRTSIPPVPKLSNTIPV